MTETAIRPSRRTVVRATAWSVPVVSVAAAAPAFALTCAGTAQNFTLNWSATAATGFASSKPTPLGTHTATANATGPGTNPAVVVTFVSNVTGATTRATDNLSVFNGTNLGGLGITSALQLRHTGFTGGFGNRETIQISFSRAVTGLSFTMTDIDSLTGGYYDRVTLDGTRSFSVNTTTISNNNGNGNGNQTTVKAVFGDGTGSAETETQGPWRFRNADTSIDSNDNRGNVTVTYPGTIGKNVPITLTYWSANNGTNQQVLLGNFTFTTPGC